MLLRLVAVAALMSAPLMASRLDDALELQRQGKLKEAGVLLRTAAAEFRAARDRPKLAEALSAAARISVALGDYHAAAGEAQEAVALRRALQDEAAAKEDFNTLGLANLYLGNYAKALTAYQEALRRDRALHDTEGEIIRLNNIGNVFYFQGRYMDALHSYDAAFERVNATVSEKWHAAQKELTLANLATLYQRLGKEQSALEIYAQLAASAEAMPESQHAQLLLNEGVLYRRLGDPIKALEFYHKAQVLFALDHHRDGEIGALRNIGIALAADLHDLQGALHAFSSAHGLAVESGNSRGIAHAGLYLAEIWRRLGRPAEAESDARQALEEARRAGLIEEQWMAWYQLGRAAEDRQQRAMALDSYRKAIDIIESVRAGIGSSSLRSEFLADKRDVYDALIALRLRESPAPVKEVYWWIERSRARTLKERVKSPALPLDGLQARLAEGTVLLDFWVANQDSALLWVTASGAGIVRFELAGDTVAALLASLKAGNEQWKGASRALGGDLLAGVPPAGHIIVVPDGPLHAVPFEALTPPGSDELLIERADVSYLPSAQFLARPESLSRRQWRWPWCKQLVAFGDPPVAMADTLAASELWQPLPASADEVRSLARLVPGRTEIHLGPDARKYYLLDHRVAGVPLLHFATHALADEEDPDRSRILMASGSHTAPADYIFEKEVYDLDLQGVDLVTLSACDTARGKTVRGEGVEAFSQAFLAAGAAATVTSLWRVADQPTADFMKQFYYGLTRGQSKAAALRSAKLAFVHSHSKLSNPQYWAAFVLTGDGWNPCARAMPASLLLLAAGIALALAAAALWDTRKCSGRDVPDPPAEVRGSIRGIIP